VDLTATGDVFVCRGERDLWGIDAASGEVRWHRIHLGSENAPETLRKFLIVHERLGYLASSGELDAYLRLTAVDPAIGESLWNRKVAPGDAESVHFDDAAAAGDEVVLTLTLEPYAGASGEDWTFIRAVLDGADGHLREK
jgi:outer membrane protein assembly factor BamB